MDFQDLESKIYELVEEYLNGEDTINVAAQKLGLDSRCGNLIVNTLDQVIVVRRSQDRNLQYYGGFEYVKQGRAELGEYIFYSADQSDRVAKCFETLEELEHDQAE